MSMNDRNEGFVDRNEGFVDKNDAAADASEGELSQDELDNVSGGLRAAAMPGQPDGRLMAGKNDFQDDDDKSDARSMA